MKTKFAALCLSLLAVGAAIAQTSDSLLKYDYRSLVAHSDLSFNTPAPSREKEVDTPRKARHEVQLKGAE
jgi:hypothetical protein